MASRDNDLPTGTRVLITGASSGIGLAAAERFRDAGATLALLARESDGLREAAERVGGVAVAADVTNRVALEQAVAEAVSRLGGLDVLVVNAGAAAFGPFSETSPEEFERTVEITLLGAVNTIRASLPELARTDGTIVVTTSVVARIPMPLMSAYAAAKHGLRGFVRSLRSELRATGSKLRISIVAPGPVDTPFWTHTQDTDGRLPPPPPAAYDVDDVAKAIVGCAASPRAERSVGRATAAAYVIDALAGPLVERVLGLGARLALSQPRRPGVGSALWEPSGGAAESGDAEERGAGVLQADGQ